MSSTQSLIIHGLVDGQLIQAARSAGDNEYQVIPSSLTSIRLITSARRLLLIGSNVYDLRAMISACAFIYFCVLSLHIV